MTQHFFYNDVYCGDIEALLIELEIDENEIETELSEDWEANVELCDLEPMFKADASDIAELLQEHHMDRSSEDGDEMEVIEKALKECTDFDKLNSMIPKLWYPNGTMVKLTRKDILDYVKSTDKTEQNGALIQQLKLENNRGLTPDWRIYKTSEFGYAVKDDNAGEWRAVILKINDNYEHDLNRVKAFLISNDIPFKEE